MGLHKLPVNIAQNKLKQGLWGSNIIYDLINKGLIIHHSFSIWQPNFAYS